MLISVIEHPPAFGMKADNFNRDEIKDMPAFLMLLLLTPLFLTLVGQT